MNPRRVTLKEVCEEGGVSLYTASRALSGHAGVAAETRRHVREVAARIGYVPNQHARSLKGTRSRVVGVIAASKANQYYATLVGALEESIGARGYSCFVADAAPNGVYSREREDTIVTSLIQQRVAAVVVTCVIGNDNLALLSSWGIPVLFVDCVPPPDWSAHPSVSTDSFNGSLAVGHHLADLGYRRWCFLGHARNWNTREPRQAGFEAAAAARGAGLETVEGGNDSEVARQALIALLTRTSPAERPQVVYASNTILLKGALQALRDCGVAIPGGMAVVAFDDFDWAPLMTPPITVVDQDISLVGRTAGGRLLSLLDDEPDAPPVSGAVTVAPRLIVRESCGAALASADRAGVAQDRERPGEKRARH